MTLDNGGAAVLAITAIKPGTPGANPQNDEQLINTYLGATAKARCQAYVLELQRRATVKTNPPCFSSGPSGKAPDRRRVHASRRRPRSSCPRCCSRCRRTGFPR